MGFVLFLFVYLFLLLFVRFSSHLYGYLLKIALLPFIQTLFLLDFYELCNATDSLFHHTKEHLCHATSVAFRVTQTHSEVTCVLSKRSIGETLQRSGLHTDDHFAGNSGWGKVGCG